ncbi:MarR family winged helix-turn-helix transcriptional regulator [Amycolatopsis minnesotensis]|uniref:MarR family transcriptional regulator n=1 Tax=Amycolatopsis minnesotensis TaxID=337894 RepID=A0ABN2SQY6_9PSEU
MANRPRGDAPPAGAAFLLPQLGAHAADRFAERIAPLGLAPRHVGLLRWISHNSATTQRDVATAFGVRPSRIVVLLDELEELGLVRREVDPADRRNRAVRLTTQGRRALTRVGQAFLTHQNDLLSALTSSEQATLATLLARVAEQQGLSAGVHPAYRDDHASGHP